MDASSRGGRGPCYVHGHHVALMRKEVAAVHAAGQVTASEVARVLGISGTSLMRLERRLGLVVPRTGKHALRSYAPEHMAALRAARGPTAQVVRDGARALARPG